MLSVFYSSFFKGIEKKMKNGQTEQNQGVRLGFVCPKSHKGTSSGEVCS